MIPNTDINCGKCAAPIYSDCVMWAGKDLPCLQLTQDCCDVSLTQVVNTLGGYICNFSYISGYTIPVCLSSYNITDFKGMQQAMLSQICNNSDKIGNISSITWGCVTSGATSTIYDSIGAVVAQVNNQTISYSDTQFTVTGSTCSNRGLFITKPTWTSFSSTTSFSGITHSNGGDAYLIDNQGNVRIQAASFTINDTQALETYVSGTLGSFGYYIPVFKVPSQIQPTSGSGLRTKFFVDTYVSYISGNTNFYDSNNVVSTEYVSSTFTYVSATPSASTVSSTSKPYKKIIPGTLIKGSIDNNWYFCVDKQYFPGGVNFSTARLTQTSTVRCYFDSITYNVNN